MPRVHDGKARLMRAGQRHTHARLQDAVASHDPTAHGIIHRAIERMRNRADECRCGIRREHRVGVERDDVAHTPQRRDIAFNHRERLGRTTAQISIELGQLPPLALPSHPDALRRVPAPRAMEQIERIAAPRGVPGIQRTDSRDRSGHNVIIAGERLRRRIRKVAQHREMQIRPPVGQELHLEVGQRLIHRLH